MSEQKKPNSGQEENAPETLEEAKAEITSSPEVQKKQIPIYITAIILATITFVTALMLSALNFVTNPVITKRLEEEKTAVLKELFNDNIEAIPLDGTLPPPLYEMYKIKDSTSGSAIGYAITTMPKGFGGKISILVAFDNSGKITGTQVLSMSETAGIGTKVRDASFRDRFIGKSEGDYAVDTIGGATVSSSAFIRGVEAAVKQVAETIDANISEEEVTDSTEEMTTDEIPAAAE